MPSNSPSSAVGNRRAIRDLQLKNEQLKRRNAVLKKYKRDSINYRLTMIWKLNDDELHQLKQALKEGLQTMENEEHNRLRKEIGGQCALCLETFNDSPPVCFIDGCDHVAICSACNKDNYINQCPLCRVPFTKTKIMKIWNQR